VAPVERTRSIIDGIVAALGPYQSIAPNRSRFTVTFAHGTVQIEGKVDDSGAFAGLFFSRMQGPAATQSLTTFFKRPDARYAFQRQVSRLDTDRKEPCARGSIAGAVRFVCQRDDRARWIVRRRVCKRSATALIFLGPADKIEGLVFRPH